MKTCIKCQGNMLLHVDPDCDEHLCSITYWRCVQCSMTLWVRPIASPPAKNKTRVSTPQFAVHKEGSTLGGWANAVKFQYPVLR